MIIVSASNHNQYYALYSDNYIYTLEDLMGQMQGEIIAYDFAQSNAIDSVQQKQREQLYLAYANELVSFDDRLNNIGRNGADWQQLSLHIRIFQIVILIVTKIVIILAQVVIIVIIVTKVVVIVTKVVVIVAKVVIIVTNSQLVVVIEVIIVTKVIVIVAKIVVKVIQQ